MASSSSSHPQMDIITSIEHGNYELDPGQYLELYKAALRGDWRYAPIYPATAYSARITPNLETALHITVGTGNATSFFTDLVRFTNITGLALKNKDGDTALSIAAMVGNVVAAKVLLKKSPDLFDIANNDGRIPLLEAARHGQKEMVLFLLRNYSTRVSSLMEPYVEKPGFLLLNLLIIAGFHDVALHLIQQYPRMAMVQYYGGESLLSTIAGKPTAFPSGTRLKFWQRIIYFCIPSKLKTLLNELKGIMENPNSYMQMNNKNPIIRMFFIALLMSYAVPWEVFTRLAPPVKHIRNAKFMHHQTLQLVKCLCNELTKGDYLRASSLFKRPLLLAAQLGIHEVVEEIVESCPHAIWFYDESHHNIFHLAVLNRQEKNFNLMYQISAFKHLMTVPQDTSGNNILHLAGKLAPAHKLNLESGAALQMQRELHWFKEVEKFVMPAYKEDINSEGKTPAMVFTEAHKDLVKEGEKWMKDIANSCIFVAALIATISFAATISLLGVDDQDDFLSMSTNKTAFTIFGFSALSLFSSTASVLMFLSILTSRYAEADFLYALPKRLIIGLVTLFLSIIFMIIAFGASVLIVFGRSRQWVLIPVALFACVPVTLFASLQFSVLVEMINTTYGPSIFHKQSKHKLH